MNNSICYNIEYCSTEDIAYQYGDSIAFKPGKRFNSFIADAKPIIDLDQKKTESGHLCQESATITVKDSSIFDPIKKSIHGFVFKLNLGDSKILIGSKLHPALVTTKSNGIMLTISIKCLQPQGI